ncbi:MAG: hypothetical protein JO323_21375 [Acidobacteriia bacterium]|nr:hypothetical protein [Terriglobia bacterium]
MKFGIVLLAAIWIWLLPATLAAAAVGLLVWLINLPAHWPWFVWLLLSPTLYTCWLVAFLTFCALSMRRLGKHTAKPKYLRLPGDNPKGAALLLAAANRRFLVSSLPLVPVLELSEFGKKLVMRTYAPSVNIGAGSQIAGSLRDPELTEIGPGTVIGAGVAIAAHAWTALPSGKMVYVTAPVKVGARVTVGGGAIVSYGCVIGDDAIIEPLSYLAPHTEVPPGEIWGGTPAIFQRKRANTGR